MGDNRKRWVDNKIRTPLVDKKEVDGRKKVVDSMIPVGQCDIRWTVCISDLWWIKCGVLRSDIYSLVFIVVHLLQNPF